MAMRSFGIFLRFAFVSLLAVWLSGCGLPPAIAIMSSAADGLSFIASGRSFPDVALSAMTDKDCMVYRIVANMEICREAESDRRAAEVVVSRETAAEWDRVDETSDQFYMLRHGAPVLATSVAELTTSRARLMGFADRTELFALIQDDGTLEVFAHDPARAGERANMQLVIQIAGYTGTPDSFRLLHLNGARIAVEDIIV